MDPPAHDALTLLSSDPILVTELVTELVRSLDDTENRPLRVGADPLNEFEELELFIALRKEKGGKGDGDERGGRIWVF